MSFGYKQGDEASALDYFEKRLEQTLSSEERRQLTDLVEKLRAVLEAQGGPRQTRVTTLTSAGLSNAAR
jgi:hypothetical protein